MCLQSLISFVCLFLSVASWVVAENCENLAVLLQVSLCLKTRRLPSSILPNVDLSRFAYMHIHYSPYFYYMAIFIVELDGPFLNNVVFFFLILLFASFSKLPSPVHYRVLYPHYPWELYSPSPYRISFIFCLYQIPCFPESLFLSLFLFTCFYRVHLPVTSWASGRVSIGDKTCKTFQI